MAKIFISGGPGSGKTTYAKKLAAENNIPHFDLDDIKWINQKNNFNVERPKEDRLKLRDKILSENDNWVIEGIYTKDWIIPILEQADRIIILKPSTTVRQWRIIKRSCRRMLHIEQKTHKENVVTLFKLLVWSRSYDKYLPELLAKIQKLNKTPEFIR
ncbi:MAG: hypothetical protein IKN73_01480 [Alphaproteobacteria bacterium]|nr:hypothetical protein [Alphaproteobacteria bacterium]